jgi:outer membrane lipoprotein-sorting protein
MLKNISLKSLIIFTFTIIFLASVSQAQESVGGKVYLTDKNSKLVYEAQEYLSKIKTAKTRFIQINPNSIPISEGQFYISKPGKLVIKYTHPYNLAYFIEDEEFIQYDIDLDQVTRASAPDNPLRVLLYDDIKFFDNEIMDIGGIKDEGDIYSIYLASKADNYAEMSGLILTFQKAPTKLVGIRRVDADGNYTTMDLTNLEINVDLPEGIFAFSQPKPKFPTSKR